MQLLYPIIYSLFRGSFIFMYNFRLYGYLKRYIYKEGKYKTGKYILISIK